MKHPPRRFDALTPRETEIVALLTEGLTSREIGARLGISGTTVRTYIDDARTRLRMRNRAQLAAWWVAQKGEKK